MASKKTKKTAPPRARRTAIVPRVVFQTVVAASVVPVMGLAAGCGSAEPMLSVAMVVDAGQDAGDDAAFSVAMVLDGGRDAGTFSVAVPVDSGLDAGELDGGETDSGLFAVAIPLDGAFSVVIAPLDGSSSS